MSSQNPKEIVRIDLTAEQKEKWNALIGERLPADELCRGSAEVLWAKLSHNSHKP